MEGVEDLAWVVLSEGQAWRTPQGMIRKQVPGGVGNPPWSRLRRNILTKGPILPEAEELGSS